MTFRKCYVNIFSQQFTTMSLTKYKEGSVRELWSLSFPLMLSSLSVMLMLFVDRLLLANFSQEAFNAAVNSTTLGWTFLYGGLILTSVAEVFVAQYNGAGQKEKLGEPVWQMLWLSLVSLLFFLPAAYIFPALFYGSGPERILEREYFSWMLFFGPSYLFYGALCGFFVGQGKIRIITWLAVISNLLNAGLDIVLIFGFQDIIPPLGITGAAIATSGSQIFQVFILFFVFQKKTYREQSGTADWRPKLRPFLQCIKIGLPGSLFNFLEIGGWAVFYLMMGLVSEAYLTIAGICQSIEIFFYFFGEGLSKGVSTVSGNLIGAGRSHLVSKTVKSSIKLQALFFISALAIVIFAFEFIQKLFLPNFSLAENPEFSDSLYTSILLITLYLFFSGIRMALSGALTAAGDTLFLLAANTFSSWCLMVLPVYLLVVQMGFPVEAAVAACVGYGILSSLILSIRFKKGSWKTIVITA